MPAMHKASVGRPVRTAVQGTVAYALVEFVDAFAFDMSERQYGAAVVLLTLVLSWVQVLVEDFTGKALLRDADES